MIHIYVKINQFKQYTQNVIYLHTKNKQNLRLIAIELPDRENAFILMQKRTQTMTAFIYQIIQKCLIKSYVKKMISVATYGSK